jgi:hypothetical protein
MARCFSAARRVSISRGPRASVAFGRGARLKARPIIFMPLAVFILFASRKERAAAVNKEEACHCSEHRRTRRNSEARHTGRDGKRRRAPRPARINSCDLHLAFAASTCDG